MPASVYDVYNRIKANISKVIVGKDETIDMLIVSMLCSSHVLLDDVPGTGKTMLVKTFAKSIGCDYKRIQFTPDLLPSDITGINYFNMKVSEFEFIPGPIFTNIVLADEINRATPKTQSGLLECMEERQATIDGKTYPMSFPFMVIATQNPVETMGTFPLPEAQIDRFLMKCSMDYPTFEENIGILDRFDKSNPLDSLESVISIEELQNAIRNISDIYICRDLKAYITKIVEATRNDSHVILGVSPRGALALMKAAKGYAAIQNRDYVLPDDIKKVAHPVLDHRLILENASRIRKNAATQIINDIISVVPVPTEAIFEGR